MATSDKNKGVFDTLVNVNVNDHTEKKKSGSTMLTYLSWAWAWQEVKKRYPDANYEIVKFDEGVPYTFDPYTGYMVYTKVTIEGITHEMWLPVMDSNNRAMKAEPYQYTTQYGTKTVQAATMFDVNKTIMRCLVKNLAMFGLGLYIYAGEDLPEDADQEQTTAPSKPSKKSQASGFVCENCKQPITDAEGHTAKEIIVSTKKQFNHVFCMECAHKVQEHLNNKKKEETPKEPEMEIDEASGLPFPMN